MKGRGGSAALAAMLRQRTEVGAPPEMVQKSMQSSPPEQAAPAPPAAPPAPPKPVAVAPPPPPAPVKSAPPAPPAPSKPAVAAAANAAAAAATPNNTYLPKTMSFQGTPKCCVCEKSVYKVEEVLALGRPWHDKCFRCGGRQPVGENPGCGKVLKRDGYLDHHSEPFCTACYNKLYRPKGFGFGNTLSTDYGPAESSSDKAEPVAEQSSTSPVSPPAPAKPAPPAPAPAAPAPPAPVAAPALAAAAAHLKPAPPAPLARVSSQSLALLGARNATPKCTVCAKSVYKVEEVLAVNRVWHAACFTCGGTTSDGCGKVLKRDNYLDHDNQPFCNACYSKNFRPKGFGFSNTLSTDYGPAESSSTKSTKSDDPAPAASVAPPSPAKPAPPAALPAPALGSAAAKAAIGVSTRALKDSSLHAEAQYVGDNDEVDESEW